jgi:hypothetical protein
VRRSPVHLFRGDRLMRAPFFSVSFRAFPWFNCFFTPKHPTGQLCEPSRLCGGLWVQSRKPHSLAPFLCQGRSAPFPRRCGSPTGAALVVAARTACCTAGHGPADLPIPPTPRSLVGSFSTGAWAHHGTASGRATAFLLQFNTADRVRLRRQLQRTRREGPRDTLLQSEADRAGTLWERLKLADQLFTRSGS